MPTVVEVFSKLRDKLGEEGAKTLVEFVQESVEKGAATKEDLIRVESGLKEEIKRVEIELGERINKVETGLRREINRVEVELGERISKVEAVLRGEIDKVRGEFNKLDKRVERFFYLTLLALLILNGDKVVTFLGALVKLFGK